MAAEPFLSDYMLDFLSLSKEIYGLEIADTYARMMRLAHRNGGLVVVAAGFLRLPEGAVQSGEIRDEKSLAAAISELAGKTGAAGTGRAAVVSLPEDKAFWQIIKMPRLDDDELRGAVIFEAENYIPLPLDKVYLDFEVVPSSLIENRCEVAVAALPKEIVDSRVRVCDAAKLRPVAMELESQAVARSARQNANFAWPAIIIKVGDTQSSVIFCGRDSTRAVFSVPISNTYFIEKIRAAAGVDDEGAKKLKTDCGIAAADSNPAARGGGEEKEKIFEFLLPGLVDFSQQIKKYIRYYQEHEKSFRADKLSFRKAIICGDGSDLKGLDEFLSLRLGIPVERMVLPIGIEPHRFKSVDFPEKSAHGCAVAAGLAARALAIESARGGGRPPE
ncbi:MAG: pilus assembly protein PilM [Candidatus Yanofskyibacterium parasiticum]|nr:MAG: pilus assembly protein PilM [Candidatus Yanofskybacteria bacterium]